VLGLLFLINWTTGWGSLCRIGKDVYIYGHTCTWVVVVVLVECIARVVAVVKGVLTSVQERGVSCHRRQPTYDHHHHDNHNHHYSKNTPPQRHRISAVTIAANSARELPSTDLVLLPVFPVSRPPTHALSVAWPPPSPRSL